MRREKQALQESVRKLQTAAELEKSKASAHSSAVMQKLEDENETLRRENEILLNAHHESKHTNELLRAANEEGREAVSAMQRKILDLEETIRQNEVAALKAVSADEAGVLKMQLDLLKSENDELQKNGMALKKENELLRTQQEGRRSLPERSSLDSVSGLDETDSELNSLDVTLHKGEQQPCTLVTARARSVLLCACDHGPSRIPIRSANTSLHAATYNLIIDFHAL